ncbi:hypothetical protein [Leifsonia sp. 2MCAF36]|uniref:hypothetical protein n=1 Tax=Leifsonia sp. 2MCAF36 TaxID=3232988 RepID=UPI003F97C4A6
MNQTNRQIIEAAINAATVEDANALAAMIEGAIGTRWERPVGDRYNNYGLLASSGSYEYKALEPVTNSQDAVLERLAVRKWGAIEGVPYSSPEEAADDLLSGLNYQQQADTVTVAFKESDHPARSTKLLTVVYRDEGCGMTPEQIPNTVFALGSSHKTSSAWHQGAYGIGGASTYRNAKAVVLVTRRAPEMGSHEDLISVAVVQWEALGKAQSAFYLVASDPELPGGGVPWSAPASDYPEFAYGTQLSLISYGVEGIHRALRSGDERSFDTILNTRLFRPVMPVRFTNEVTRGKREYLRGLGKRLDDNPSPDRPTDDDEVLYSYGGQTYKLPIRYWVFPTGDKGSRRRFVAKGHTLAFTSNGQIHHHWSSAQFKLRTRLHKLDERIFVLVETDNLPIELRTALFTPDRSQMLSNEAAIQLEDQVADFISGWPQLAKINDQLVREAVANTSSGRSMTDVSRRISSAFNFRGFGTSGSGTKGGSAGGNGGPRVRKRVETYPNPTTFEGPDRLVLEDGKYRYVEYMLNATDDFLGARGDLTFSTTSADIDVSKHIHVGKLRDGYVRVQLHVPEGAAEGEFELVAELDGWLKASGGMGPRFAYTTKIQIVDEISTGGASGPKTGTKGSSAGSQVAVVWTTPETYGESWNNGTPGSIDDVAAATLAERDDYKELASLGETPVKTLFLNETYAPYKAYISARAKDLKDVGAQRSSDRYAVGVGLGLLIIDEEYSKETHRSGKPANEAEIRIAQQAVARSVLFMMPSYDDLTKQMGLDEDL